MDEEVVSLLLDTEQELVAAAAIDDRRLVIAGPGTGKTQTLASLVENLVVDEELDTVSELLILSFSNAAVHAVDARLRARDVPPVHVRTIDSLASVIVSDAGEDPSTMSFDQRVKRATQILDGGEWDALEDVLHLVVDEVQDVVGVRADFLLALLEALPEEAGFAFLGDPAQAIYDFQIDAEKGSGTTCADLIVGAKEAGAETVVLAGQYRARGVDVTAILEHRSADGQSTLR